MFNLQRPWDFFFVMGSQWRFKQGPDRNGCKLWKDLANSCHRAKHRPRTLHGTQASYGVHRNY